MYRRVRRSFAAKVKEKELLYDKIEDYKKQLDNLETFIPSAAAIWTTVINLFIFRLILYV